MTRATRLLAWALAAWTAVVLSVGVRAQAGRSVEGVWNFSTLTPLERPTEFTGRPLISDGEADAWVTQSVARNDRDSRDGGA